MARVDGEAVPLPGVRLMLFLIHSEECEARYVEAASFEHALEVFRAWCEDDTPNEAFEPTITSVTCVDELEVIREEELGDGVGIGQWVQIGSLHELANALRFGQEALVWIDSEVLVLYGRGDHMSRTSDGKGDPLPAPKERRMWACVPKPPPGVGLLTDFTSVENSRAN
jgi:hypothetical protein